MAYQNYNYGTGGYVYPTYTNNFTMPPQFTPSAQMMQSPQQPQMPAQAPQTVPQAPQNSMNNFTYVNGIEGAKAFTLPPNATCLLMDNDNPTFYIKTSDYSGRSNMKIYDFTERSEGAKQETSVPQTSVDLSGIATKDDILGLYAAFEDLKSSIVATDTKKTNNQTKSTKGGEDK